jgi:hypothetical protein
MKNVRSKTHIAGDRFVILLEENAQFIVTIAHWRCVWCLNALLHLAEHSEP